MSSWHLAAARPADVRSDLAGRGDLIWPDSVLYRRVALPSLMVVNLGQSLDRVALRSWRRMDIIQSTATARESGDPSARWIGCTRCQITHGQTTPLLLPRFVTYSGQPASPNVYSCSLVHAIRYLTACVLPCFNITRRRVEREPGSFPAAAEEEEARRRRRRKKKKSKMGSVLRFVWRRSRSLPPAFEGKLPRQDALKAVDAMAPDQHVFHRQVMPINGFSPRFNGSQSSFSLRNAKVGVDQGLVRRGFFTSSRPSPPPEKYWLEVVGHRNLNPHSPNTTFYRKRIEGVDKDEAEAMLRKLLWKMKSNRKFFPNGVPGLTLYQKIILIYGKVRLSWLEHLSLMKSRYLLKFIGIELLVACLLVYGYFGRPLSFVRRFWAYLKSRKNRKDLEQKVSTEDNEPEQV